LEFGNVINVNIKLQEERTILTLENYKANFCIFFNNSYNPNIDIKNNQEDQDRSKKFLKAIYVSLKGDIYSSPNFDTTVNISMMDNYVVLYISGNDLSKFRASILSFLRMIDLVYATLYLNN
jgi:tRNA threonylcarbamoyladenosine modification (KEOPS) complex  Pcc1 subunit